MKPKNFTFIELLILIVIIGIVVAIVSGTTLNHSQCRSGYEWVMDVNGTLHQVIGEDGRPVRCVK